MKWNGGTVHRGRAIMIPRRSTMKRSRKNRSISFAWLFTALHLVAANVGPTSSTATTLSGKDNIASGMKENQIFADTGNAFGRNIYDRWRQDLPIELRSEKGAPLHRIDMDGVVIYLLGSSHVSRASCDDAKLLMQHIRPDALFVELCAQRVGLLLSTPEELANANGNRKESLLYAIQAGYAKKLNVTVGGEFRSAFQFALDQERQYRESQGISDPRSEISLSTSTRKHVLSTSASHPRGNRPCATILGDRPVQLTLHRAWDSLRFFGKLRLLIALLWSSVRQPSEKEIREWMETILNDRSGKKDLITQAINELGNKFPTLKQVIIDERDEFMSAKLRQTAALMHSCAQDGEIVIVAVVGACHCPGMLEKLVGSDGTKRPEDVLPSLINTKKNMATDEEINSLVTDIIHFDYSYVLQN